MFSLLGLGVVLALMVLLVLLAAIGLAPERPRSLGPIPPAPHFEATVGDSVALAGPRLASVAPRVPAPGVQVSAGRPASRPSGGASAGETLSVAPAQAVDVSGSAPAATQPAPQAQPVSAPAPEPVPAPIVATAPSPTPSGAGTGTGGPHGPISAGVTPDEGEAEEGSAVCEGTEYTVTVSVDLEAIFSGATDAEILVQRVGGDGSEAVLQLEGGLEDLTALLDQLAGEGPCVSVEIEPLSDAEPAEQPESPQPPG